MSRLGPKGVVEVRVPRADALAFLGAAYLMTQDCRVALSGPGRALLWPKRPKNSARLAEAFYREYRGQRLRWRLARAGRALRAAAASRALAFSDRLADHARTLMPELGVERRAEIERLLLEAEAQPRDPLGIATPWEELRRKP